MKVREVLEALQGVDPEYDVSVVDYGYSGMLPVKGIQVITHDNTVLSPGSFTGVILWID